MTDPQVAHLECFTDYDVHGAPVRLVAHPLRYDGVSPSIHRMPLQAGCDTREILAGCGFAESAIDTLLAEGVIGSPPDAASAHSSPFT